MICKIGPGPSGLISPKLYIAGKRPPGLGNFVSCILIGHCCLLLRNEAFNFALFQVKVESYFCPYEIVLWMPNTSHGLLPHDDVTTCKRFPHYQPFPMVIQWSTVNSTQKGLAVFSSLDFVVVVSGDRLSNKHSNYVALFLRRSSWYWPDQIREVRRMISLIMLIYSINLNNLSTIHLYIVIPGSTPHQESTDFCNPIYGLWCISCQIASRIVLQDTMLWWGTIFLFWSSHTVKLLCHDAPQDSLISGLLSIPF